MAHTYTQLYIHIVFAVQGRLSLIRPRWKDDLERYITGIIQRHDHKVVAINAQPDHVHILIGMNPKEALSDLVRDAKAGSSKHVNDMRWVMGRFQWQEGYGAFSCGRSTLPDVIHYVENQAEHHARRTLGEEFRGLLKRYDVTFEEAYLFKDVDEKDVRRVGPEGMGHS